MQSLPHALILLDKHSRALSNALRHFVSRDSAARPASRQQTVAFEELNARAADAKRVSSPWLFETRNRKAQDLRLKIHVEHDAFARMTAHWQRLRGQSIRDVHACRPSQILTCREPYDSLESAYGNVRWKAVQNVR